MSKWMKDIDAYDFLEWIKKNEEEYLDLFPFLLPTIKELEQEDFFGTEGFDKRFG